MSKVCQHLLSLSAALSLAGLFASVMLWVHSYSWDGFDSYRIKEGMATRSICLFVSPGQVAVASGVTLMPAPLGLEYKKFSQATFDRTVERHQYSLFGFRSCRCYPAPRPRCGFIAGDTVSSRPVAA